MKSILLRLLPVIILGFFTSISFAQVKNKKFKVNGDSDKFYPVTFTDSAWWHNEASEIAIGRANTHEDSTRHGALIAVFRYLTTNWGHGANFISADIRQFQYEGHQPFIAGYKDASGANASCQVIIWLRGATSYFFSSRYNDSVTVYDGSRGRELPFLEGNGTGAPIQNNYKTTVDSNVPNGIYYSGDTYYAGATNYFAGNVGIGIAKPVAKFDIVSNVSWTSNNWGRAIKLNRGSSIEFDAGNKKYGMGATTEFFFLFSSESDTARYPASYNLVGNSTGDFGIGTYPQTGYKLAVEGQLGARKIKVTQQSSWADFVFKPGYKLPSLSAVETYINENGHLPEMPNEKEVKENGVDIGEMNRLLLQKVEELTLHLIRQEKMILSQQAAIEILKKKTEKQH